MPGFFFFWRPLMARVRAYKPKPPRLSPEEEAKLLEGLPPPKGKLEWRVSYCHISGLPKIMLDYRRTPAMMANHPGKLAGLAKGRETMRRTKAWAGPNPKKAAAQVPKGWTKKAYEYVMEDCEKKASRAIDQLVEDYTLDLSGISEDERKMEIDALKTTAAVMIHKGATFNTKLKAADNILKYTRGQKTSIEATVQTAEQLLFSALAAADEKKNERA